MPRILRYPVFNGDPGSGKILEWLQELIALVPVFLVTNPNFSVEKFALREDDSGVYGLNVLVNPD